MRNTEKNATQAVKENLLRLINSQGDDNTSLVEQLLKGLDLEELNALEDKLTEEINNSLGGKKFTLWVRITLDGQYTLRAMIYFEKQRRKK